MEFFINYLLESSIILGILVVFYRIVLHHEPLFKFNRVFLLLSLVLATVVPFIHISLQFQSSNQVDTSEFVNLLGTVNVFADDVKHSVVPVIAQSKFFNWLYIGGAIGLLVRLLIGLVRLGALSRKATWIKHNGIKVADLPGRFNPFSFYRVIFVNRSNYSGNELEKILIHEMAHVRLKHSVDVLLFEILLIVQWFNPFAWLIKALLKELHEFQADRSVLEQGTSVGDYKSLLLNQAAGARLMPVNNFNQSITKKRFKMMTNNIIKNKAFIKYFTSCAIILGISMFFACENATLDDLSNEEESRAELKSVASDAEEDLAPTFYIVEKMPEYPGGEMELRKFIAQNVKYPVKAQEKGITGKVYVQFVVSERGEVVESKIVRGVDESLDNEALRVVNAMPDWTPGLQRGEKVRVYYTIPINFVMQSKAPAKTVEKPDENEVTVVTY